MSSLFNKNVDRYFSLNFTAVTVLNLSSYLFIEIKPSERVCLLKDKWIQLSYPSIIFTYFILFSGTRGSLVLMSSSHWTGHITHHILNHLKLPVRYFTCMLHIYFGFCEETGVPQENPWIYTGKIQLCLCPKLGFSQATFSLRANSTAN